MTAITTGRHAQVGRDALRVDVPTRVGAGTPLQTCRGIGSHHEALQPLVDSIDPGIEIICVDVPGGGGSPASDLPLRFRKVASFASISALYQVVAVSAAESPSWSRDPGRR